MRIVWYVLFLASFTIPALMLLARMAADALPINSGVGAFIMAGGALSLLLSFPVANRFRSVSVEALNECGRMKKLDDEKIKKLFSLMVIGSVLAELPSVAGLVHYFATREVISSLILCTPAIVLMFAIYRPLELDDMSDD